MVRRLCPEGDGSRPRLVDLASTSYAATDALAVSGARRDHGHRRDRLVDGTPVDVPDARTQGIGPPCPPGRPIRRRNRTAAVGLSLCPKAGNRKTCLSSTRRSHDGGWAAHCRPNRKARRRPTRSAGGLFGKRLCLVVAVSVPFARRRPSPRSFLATAAQVVGEVVGVRRNRPCHRLHGVPTRRRCRRCRCSQRTTKTPTMMQPEVPPHPPRAGHRPPHKPPRDVRDLRATKP